MKNLKISLLILAVGVVVAGGTIAADNSCTFGSTVASLFGINLAHAEDDGCPDRIYGALVEGHGSGSTRQEAYQAAVDDAYAQAPGACLYLEQTGWLDCAGSGPWCVPNGPAHLLQGPAQQFYENCTQADDIWSCTVRIGFQCILECVPDIGSGG